MINEKELEIANISYTNKDFGVIYTEILDTARKLSELWTPQSSNESDPGVVLLKLLAFIADKINYNLDKNILETGMPSATQESSMRKLCDMMGYYMNYYTSATTYATFTYKGSALNITNEDRNTKYITLPKYQTVISNEDNSLQYVVWEDVSLDSTSKSDTVLVREGFLNTLNVGDSDKITLDNLNSQNRIYFGESQVAQNGVLIRAYNSPDSNATFWTRVENLNVQDPGSRCFKFGYDSKEKLPYIEFPQDISSLIGEGLYIRYLVTSGYYGNVGVGNLTKLLSPTSVDVTGGNEVTTISFTDEEGNSVLNIKNNSAATNGANPESIDSAYNNFKKTVGTFNTLVTCRDYANYIYSNLYTTGGNHLVSNVQVGDRRTDINSAKNMITYNDFGQYVTNISTDYTKLFIHALKGINNPSNQSEYRDSFSLVSDTSAIAESLNSDDSVATISYEYNFPGTGDIALIKILYSLDVKITTTYKVNIAEQLDIKKNVIEALREKFYSRNVDFGYEIPYELIYNCILDADDRIKSIILKEPALAVEYINKDNEVMPMCGRSVHQYKDSPYLNILAKNVMAGRVPLFNYDTRFNYEFGMGEYINDGDAVVGPVLSHIKSFTSHSDIDLVEGTDTTVKANEVIQLIGPKLVNETEYSTYVNYRTNKNFEANKDTKLGADEYILFIYTDSSQNQVEVLYTEGDIIRSTFAIDASRFSDSTVTKTNKVLQNVDLINQMPDVTSSSVGCLGIPTKESIYKRAIVRHTFDSTIKVAWLVSDNVEENRLDTKFTLVSSPSSPGDTDPYVYEFILGDSDYFIYSVDGESSYEIFGSGTSLRLESDSAISVEDTFSGYCNIPNLNDLYEYGLDSISAILKNVSFAAGLKFIVQANDILTLAQGDIVRITGDSIRLDNSWQSFAEHTLDYILVDSTTQEPETLPQYNIGGGLYDDWRIRSRLDLVSGPSVTQTLEEHQSIEFTLADDDLSTHLILGALDGRIRTNIGVDIPGGENISLYVVDPNEVIDSEEPVYPVSALIFVDPNNDAENFTRSSGYYVKELETDELSKFATGYSVLQPNDLDNGQFLVMCYLTFTHGKYGRVTFTGENSIGGTVSLTNYGDGSTITYVESTAANPLDNKLLIISIPSTCTKLKITLTTSETTSIGSIVLGQLDAIDGLNKRFKLDELETRYGITAGALSTALTGIISDIDTDTIFYYTCNLDSSEEIDEEDLSSPFALFDANNIAGRFAISYIDIDDSSIEITRSSKL